MCGRDVSCHLPNGTYCLEKLGSPRLRHSSCLLTVRALIYVKAAWWWRGVIKLWIHKCAPTLCLCGMEWSNLMWRDGVKLGNLKCMDVLCGVDNSTVRCIGNHACLNSTALRATFSTVYWEGSIDSWLTACGWGGFVEGKWAYMSEGWHRRALYRSPWSSATFALVSNTETFWHITPLYFAWLKHCN